MSCRGWWDGVALGVGLVLASMAGAVMPDPLFDDPDEGIHFPDPWEGTNRSIFAFNEKADSWVIDPLARGYRWVVPSRVQRSIFLFFRNLNSPSIAVNELFQREWRAAGSTAARLGINTTAGVLGLFDPATRFGFEHRHADFGQTLALGGVDSGPYLIIPIVGPTCLRDGVGTVVDFAFRPTTYLFGSVLLGGVPGFGDQLLYSGLQGGGTGMVTRAAVQQQLEALRESSVDFYATMRTAYYQQRLGAIWDRRESHRGMREWILFIRQCQSSTPRFVRGGRRTVPRILPVSQRRCNPPDEPPAR